MKFLLLSLFPSVASAFVGPTPMAKPFGVSTSSLDMSYDYTEPANYVKKTDSDIRYPSLTVGFNQRFTADNCGAVYMVEDPADCAKALDHAIENYPGGIRVVSGRHCYEDFVMGTDTTALIDVSKLLDWGIDPNKGHYLSSGDTNWGAFNKIFKEWGVVLPGGSCYSVGLGGHISGGGDGIMSRKYGLTVDYLTGVEIVVKPDPNKPAQVLYVSRESETQKEKDLFWACTGAGCGNFGIITKYYFQTLPPAPMGAIITNIAFPWSDLDKTKLKALLDWYVDFAADTSNANTDQNNWASSGKFPISHVAAGESQLLLHTAYWTEDEKTAAKAYHVQLEQEIEDLGITVAPPSVSLPFHGGYWSRAPSPHVPRELARSNDGLDDTTTDFSFYSATQTMNPSGPNQRGKYKSAYMVDKFPQEQVDAMYDFLNKVPVGTELEEWKQSLIQIDCFGGQINTVDPTYTAVPQRNYKVKCQYQTYWVDRKLDALHLKWIRDFYDTVYAPYGGTPDPDAVTEDGHTPASELFEGCYYNYPDVDLNNHEDGVDHALHLYFLGNYDKLKDVKRDWDPQNYFYHDQSIPVVPESGTE